MAYSRAAPRVFVGADRMPSSAGWSGHNGQQGAGISQILRVLLHGYPILPSSPLPPSSADSPAAGLRSSAFVPFVMARMLSMFAQQMQAVVVAWQVYDLTRDPMSLAYVGGRESGGEGKRVDLRGWPI